jgi:hypothetical protein
MSVISVQLIAYEMNKHWNIISLGNLLKIFGAKQYRLFPFNAVLATGALN